MVPDMETLTIDLTITTADKHGLRTVSLDRMEYADLLDVLRVAGDRVSQLDDLAATLP